MSRFVLLDDDYIDKKRKIIYCKLFKRFEKFSYIKYLLIRLITVDIIELSEDEFNRNVPICECIDRGEFPDLEFEKYNMVEEFKKVYNGKYFDQLQFNRGSFYKIACLKCGTCNDQYDLMVEYFEEKLNKLHEKERRKQLLNDICSKN